MSVTPDEFIAACDRYLGYEYGYWDRCGGSHHELDCSGMQCRVMTDLGLGIGCLSSFVIAQLCYQNGLYIDAITARETKAVWAFEGRNGGRGPSFAANGSDGHIIAGAGDGTTREARGHAYGVIIGPWDGRAWTGFSKIPGVDYSPPKVEVEDMIVVIDSTRPITKAGNTPYAEFLPKSDLFPAGGVRLWWGSRITGDQKSDNPNIRLFLPQPRPGHYWIGMAPRVNGSGIKLIDDSGNTSHPNVGLWQPK